MNSDDSINNHLNINSNIKQQMNLQQVFTTLHDHCSTFLNSLSQFPLFHPKNTNTTFSLQRSLHDIQNNTRLAFDAVISRFDPNSRLPSKTPLWARISQGPKLTSTSSSLSIDAIEERLAGVPVYALSNPSEEFVLVSGALTGKSLGLLCFKKEDAEALLEQMKFMDPAMRKTGSKVVAIALNKVFQLKVDGVAFRLIPEASQVQNALMEREKAGISADGFSGVPVFQSRSLVLRSQNKSYRPVFFRKEDLEKSLKRASRQQHKLNPGLRPGDIQVAAFEEIINSMKDNSNTKWDDIVFIPPGFDVSTDPSQQKM